MLIRSRNFLDSFPLYFAPEAPSGSISSGSESGNGRGTGSQDILEMLDAEEEPEVIKLDEPKPKTGKVKEDNEDEIDEDDEPDEDLDELDELEEELEGPDEDKLELVTPVRRKEILTKYPQLFKDFPYLEKAYYREQQFTELYPTIADAKLANTKAETLDGIDKELNDGNIKNLLKATKEQHPNSFNKIVDNYLDALYEIDKDAQHHVIGRIIQQTIQAMVNEAGGQEEKQGNALKSAAHILNQFVFGSSKFTPIEPLHNSKKDDGEGKDKVDEKEQKFKQQRFESTSRDLGDKVERVLKGTIDKYMDPRGSMTPYVKGHATKEAVENLEKLIASDSRFAKILDKLWERAIEDDFSESSVTKIRSAYISKAKTLLPSVIKKARLDALKGMGKRVQAEDDEHEEEEETTTPRSNGKERKGRSTSSLNSGQRGERGKNPSEGKSTLDYFMEDK